MGYIANSEKLCYNYDISQKGEAKIMVCTFFGHKDARELNTEMLKNAIEELIKNGVDTFYIGHQGDFDNMAYNCLLKLKASYPHIRFWVVLAYMPAHTPKNDLYCDYSIFPDALESVHPRFAIEKRNRWLIDRADCCICYVNYTWGGAYKFARLAKRRGLTVINVGSAEL